MERPEGFEPADAPRQSMSHDYRSGTDGTCAAYALLPGRYTVTAFRDGAGTAMAENIEVREDGEPSEVVLRLGTGGTLLSTVLDMSGNPVVNAWCRLYTPAGGPVPHGAQRGSNGVLTVPNLPPGRYTARVSGRGLSEAEHTVEIRASETTRIDDVLHAAGTVKWTLNGADGKPASGIQCRLVPQDTDSIEQPRTGATDSDGVWTVRGLAPGAYRLTAASRNGGSP